MSRTHRLLLAIACAIFTARTLPAQLKTGTPPFGSFGGGPDVMNLANMNVHIVVPVVHKAGRGLPFNYDLTYDSAVWWPAGSTGNQNWQPGANWGWISQSAGVTGGTSRSFVTGGNCTILGRITGGWSIYDNYIYNDPWGVPHHYLSSNKQYWGAGQGCVGSGFTETTNDASGWTLTVDNFGSSTIRDRNGTIQNPGAGSSGSSTDRNGNFITGNSTGVFTDTLGSAALTLTGTGTPTSPFSFTYSAPGPSGTGTPVSVTLNYTAFTVATNFGISGIHEFGATSIPLVTSAVLADGSHYTFAYEATPSTPSPGACTPLAGTYLTNCVTARIASVMLPTGGTITYAYSGGNNGILSDGSTSVLARTTPDGAWAYTHALGTGAASTTTITDPERDSLAPNGNDTVIQFQQIYETQRQVYQGSHTAGTLLQTTNTCYNGSASPCVGTAIVLGIARRTQIIQYPNSSGLQCEHDFFYNSYGSLTELDDYDCGSGSPGSALRKTLTAYATLSNGIFDSPASVKVQDGFGNTKAETDYIYDETTPSIPAGTTPQHGAITGSRGNATTIKNLVQGTIFLTSTVSYYDTGNSNVVTDVNGAQTTYNYPDATSTCGNAFPKSVSEPLSLSESMAYNCFGGVQTSLTDENNQPTTISYTDPYFWRPASITDPTSAVTYFTYTGQTSMESSLTFNSGNSTLDNLTTYDGLGRSHLQQTRQAPGATNFDSVEADYDALGRVKRSTLPFVAIAGQANSMAPAVVTSYDALNRILSTADAGGGSTSYTYSKVSDT